MKTGTRKFAIWMLDHGIDILFIGSLVFAGFYEWKLWPFMVVVVVLAALEYKRQSRVWRDIAREQRRMLDGQGG